MYFSKQSLSALVLIISSMASYDAFAQSAQNPTCPAGYTFTFNPQTQQMICMPVAAPQQTYPQPQTYQQPQTYPQQQAYPQQQVYPQQQAYPQQQTYPPYSQQPYPQTNATPYGTQPYIPQTPTSTPMVYDPATRQMVPQQGYQTQAFGSYRAQPNASPSTEAPIHTDTANAGSNTGFVLGTGLGYGWLCEPGSDYNHGSSLDFHSVTWNLLLGYRVHPYFGIYTELDISGPGTSNEEKLRMPILIYWNFIPKLHYTFNNITIHFGFGIGFTKIGLKVDGDWHDPDVKFSMKLQTGIRYAVTDHCSLGLDFDYLPILNDGSVTDHGINIRPSISYRF